MRSLRSKTGKGFTLIELLIVIGILGILAAIILVAVDPAKRLKQSRDARRSSEVNALLNAILNYTVDKVGTLPLAIQGATSTKMVGTCLTGAAVPDACSGGAGWTDAVCANLAPDLVDEYIAEIPVDPRGSHATSTFPYSASMTGYYVTRSTNGRVEVGSCNPEVSASIKAKR